MSLSVSYRTLSSVTSAELLVFKFTGSSSHHGHVTDTECRPDYTAAFQCHWGDKSTTLWPYIRLVGEAASKKKPPKDSEQLD
jgi:hypothetical protein